MSTQREKHLNKIALVTGCSSGFGHAIVGALLQEGLTVLATMRNAERGEKIFSPEQAQFGSRLEVHELDVTSSSDREQILKLLVSRFDGRLDLLINNAGFGLFGALEDLDEGQITQQMDVNFLGLTFLTRKLLPCLRKAQGRLINISSYFGVAGMPVNSMYCASKFAVEGLSEALYYELKPHGVQVALVEPGAVKTGFGSNIAWGTKSQSNESPYALQTKNYLVLKQKVGDRAPGVQDVVKTVVRLTRARQMPLRNFSGRDSKSMRMLTRLMPTVIMTGLLSIFFSRTLNRR